MVSKYAVPGVIILALAIGAAWESLDPRNKVLAPPPTTAPSSVGATLSPASTNFLLICAPTGPTPLPAAQATVVVVDSDVQVSWTWTGAPPPTGTIGLYVTLHTPDYGTIHQLGHTTDSGTQIGFFDADLSAGAHQTNIPENVTLGERGVALTFPGSAASFGNGFTAEGAVTVNGNDVMTCRAT